MRVSKLGNLVVAAVVGLPLTLVVACSDDPTPAPAPTPVQACPNTLAIAPGASCFDSTVSCDYPLPCPGGYDQQIRCFCDGKSFACKYGEDTVNKGTTPECKPFINPNPPACLASVAASEGKACTATGQICKFLGPKCADGTQKIDECICGANADGGSFIFQCIKKLCPGDGGVIPTSDAGDAGGGG